MATLQLLPSTVYRPPPPPAQVHSGRRSLNTIIEDEERSVRGSRTQQRTQQKIVKEPTPQQANNFLSPFSDHFPTPRGNHFMSAPIPASSIDSDSDVDSVHSSLPWTRNSYTTENTDFDDLYDASSDDERKTRKTKRSSQQSRKRSTGSTTSSRVSFTELPALTIPSGGDQWPGMATYKLLTATPPTPPAHVPMSPAIFKYLQAQEVPSCSAPPSLDGSLTSEQMALMSVPSTPNPNDSDADCDGWGVQLQPAAMATLHALSGGDDMYEHQPEQVIEVTDLARSPLEMQQSLPPLFTNIHRHNSVLLSPEQQRSLNSLTKLEIPSPGGFFSSLSPGTRHTWHLVSNSPTAEEAPPTSTTAEQFYKTPWNSQPVERIIEVPEVAESEGPITAIPYLPKTPKQNDTHMSSDMTVRSGIQYESWETEINGTQTSPSDDAIIPDEILANYADYYAEKLNVTAVANIDRTSLWLDAQNTYLSDLINPTEDRGDEVALLKRAASTKSQIGSIYGEIEISLDENPLPTPSFPPASATTLPSRKTVRFSSAVQTSTLPLPTPEETEKRESAYYRAFQHFTTSSKSRDTFIHRIPRFEALQSQRVSFPAQHRDHLLGKYQLSVPSSSPSKRLSSNVARGDETTPEDPAKLQREKEAEARSQLAFATWNVQASKLLNGGHLLPSPVHAMLCHHNTRAKILDLGGQPTCDWAWAVSSLYPSCTITTLTTTSLRQLSNSHIRGPFNHRNVSIDRLVKLPFKNNTFDLISAREIHTILRSSAPNGEDEWSACLAECHRVLKPGGFIDFSVQDSDIVNAGPLGLKKSVEFGFQLKTLGYDPAPTKSLLPRLHGAGFVAVKRAWVFLPMGAKTVARSSGEVVRDSMGVERRLELEAMVQGSTGDVAAVTGVLGAWGWEKWLVRAKVQTEGSGEVGDLGVVDVLEEGRGCGAGWRSLNGWGRKPWESVPGFF